MNTKKSTAIWAVAAVIVVALIAAAVWLITGDSEKQPTSADGIVEDITYTPPETNIKTQPETEATSVERTTSAAEGYVENFLAEANTYSQTVETQTTPAGQKPFFHVVTDGTVTDDNSLEGLEEPLKTVGEVILAAGFRYDKNQQIFYSEEESWQRNFGFTPFYDAAAAFTGMYYDTMRLKFNYADKDWMIQIWKGRYGITTGGEMGIYYKEPPEYYLISLFSVRHKSLPPNHLKRNAVGRGRAPAVLEFLLTYSPL